jgi:hypothetical protein
MHRQNGTPTALLGNLSRFFYLYEYPPIEQISFIPLPADLVLLLAAGTRGQYPFQLEKLPDFINSAYNEITPVPSRDGNTLYFTRVAYPEFNHVIFFWIACGFIPQVPARISTIASLRNIYSELSWEACQLTLCSISRLIRMYGLPKAIRPTSTYLMHIRQEPLNNALPNSIVAITPDPNAFYCINQFSEKGRHDQRFFT